MIKIISDFQYLVEPCDYVTDMAEGNKIADILFKVLETHKGLGLAANQIGLNKAVCVANAVEKKFFVNPQILSGHGSIKVEEGCLSFPNQQVKTERRKQIVVRADNLTKDTVFGSEDDWDLMLEAICIQHEVDHLNGITMFDRGKISG